MPLETSIVLDDGGISVWESSTMSLCPVQSVQDYLVSGRWDREWGFIPTELCLHRLVVLIAVLRLMASP